MTFLVHLEFWFSVLLFSYLQGTWSFHFQRLGDSCICSKSHSPGDLSRCQMVASVWSFCQPSGKRFCDQLFWINFLRSNLIIFFSQGLSFLHVGRFAFGASSPLFAPCTLWSSLRFRNKLCSMNWTSVQCLCLGPNLNWFLTTISACIPPSCCVPLWTWIFRRWSKLEQHFPFYSLPPLCQQLSETSGYLKAF